MPPWKAKAALQRAFSVLPGGHVLNLRFQRHISRGVPIPTDVLGATIELARRHLEGLAHHASTPIEQGRFFEFGAGWDLHVAQILYCLGVEQQLVIDVRPLLRADLVFDIRNRLASVDASFPRRPPTTHNALTDYLAAIGVEYQAPCDARTTELPDQAIDFVTSTSTLEHIPPDEISDILSECRRVLSPDGAMSFGIDYKDHYSYFDSRVGPYNFLQYSDGRWKRYNPSLHHQNRLRRSDYIQLFTRQGFEVVEETVERGAPEDIRQLKAMTVADRFRDYATDDLATRESLVVLKRATPEPTATSSAERTAD